jgi:hypothetical protein
MSLVKRSGEMLSLGVPAERSAIDRVKADWRRESTGIQPSPQAEAAWRA